MNWIQKYIHLFGGDGDQVTMLGKSSGSGDVLAQVAAYGGKQGRAPFRRALAQSAFLQYISPTLAESTYETVLNYSGVSNFAALQKVPFETLHRANNIMIGQTAPYKSSTWDKARMPGHILLVEARLRCELWRAQ